VSPSRRPCRRRARPGEGRAARGGLVRRPGRELTDGDRADAEAYARLCAWARSFSDRRATGRKPSGSCRRPTGRRPGGIARRLSGAAAAEAEQAIRSVRCDGAHRAHHRAGDTVHGKAALPGAHGAPRKRRSMSLQGRRAGGVSLGAGADWPEDAGSPSKAVSSGSPRPLAAGRRGLYGWSLREDLCRHEFVQGAGAHDRPAEAGRFAISTISVGQRPGLLFARAGRQSSELVAARSRILRLTTPA